MSGLVCQHCTGTGEGTQSQNSFFFPGKLQGRWWDQGNKAATACWALLGAQILTAPRTPRWISWFWGVEGEVWPLVCWAAVEQPEEMETQNKK